MELFYLELNSIFSVKADFLGQNRRFRSWNQKNVKFYAGNFTVQVNNAGELLTNIYVSIKNPIKVILTWVECCNGHKKFILPVKMNYFFLKYPKMTMYGNAALFRRQIMLCNHCPAHIGVSKPSMGVILLWLNAVSTVKVNFTRKNWQFWTKSHQNGQVWY